MKKYAQNLTEKIISEHLVRGRMEVGTEIFLRVDSTLCAFCWGRLPSMEESVGDCFNAFPRFCISGMIK